MAGVLREILADGRGHRKARVAVDVDLADRALCRFAELFFGNADRVRELAAVLVDRVDFVLRDGGRTVEDDREAGELLFDRVQNVERQRRRNELAGLRVAGALFGGELVRAVAGADGNCERIAAGARCEVDDLFGLGVVRNRGGDFVFDAGEDAEFGFDRHIVRVGVFHHFLGESDVFFVGKRRAVDHHAGEAGVDAALAGFESVAVVEVEDDFGLFAAEFLGVFHRALGHVAEDRGVGVFARALGDLHYDGAFRLHRGLHDGLHLFHRVEVESRNGVAALDSLREHLARIDETEILVTYHLRYSCSSGCETGKGVYQLPPGISIAICRCHTAAGMHPNFGLAFTMSVAVHLNRSRGRANRSAICGIRFFDIGGCVAPAAGSDFVQRGSVLCANRTKLQETRVSAAAGTLRGMEIRDTEARCRGTYATAYLGFDENR